MLHCCFSTPAFSRATPWPQQPTPLPDLFSKSGQPEKSHFLSLEFRLPNKLALMTSTLFISYALEETTIYLIYGEMLSLRNCDHWHLCVTHVGPTLEESWPERKQAGGRPELTRWRLGEKIKNREGQSLKSSISVSPLFSPLGPRPTNRVGWSRCPGNED